MNETRLRRPRPPSTILFLAGLLCGCAAFGDAEERSRLVEVLGLRPGMHVADVGAGDGDWAVFLAGQVGDGGRVWATEVDPEEIERIERKLAESGRRNAEVLLGDQQSTGLPASCCDAILLRMVYHHFTEPETMRRALWDALRPGGLVAVVETDPMRGWRRLEGVPDRGGHGIEPGDLRREMEGAGFELAESIDPWPGGNGEPYCAVFRRPSAQR